MVMQAFVTARRVTLTLIGSRLSCHLPHSYFSSRKGTIFLTWGNTRVNPNLSEGLSIAHSEGSVRVGQLLCLERTLPPTPVFHHVTHQNYLYLFTVIVYVSLQIIKCYKSFLSRTISPPLKGEVNSSLAVCGCLLLLLKI